MTIEIGSKGYKVHPQAAAQIAHTQGEAENLVKDHLVEPIREMQKKGIVQSPEVLAYALLEFAYFLLRRRQTPERAEQKFDVFAHFAKQNIEQKISDGDRKKQLH